MILEVRPREFGLGYQRQRWPRARHHILRIGTREVRVIVTEDATPTVAGIIGLMIAGLFM
jgi:hypothetical protein